MQVMTPSCGWAMAASAAISPGWFAPSSMTANATAGGVFSTVTGTPRWLLRLPRVACTAPAAPQASATSSLTVVLPLEPVTPIQVAPWWRRRNSVASAASAAVTSATTSTGTGTATGRVARISAAPSPTAVAAKSWPSWFAPGRQAKRLPRRTARLSMLAPCTTTSRAAPCQTPPVRRTAACWSSRNGAGRGTLATGRRAEVMGGGAPPRSRARRRR